MRGFGKRNDDLGRIEREPAPAGQLREEYVDELAARTRASRPRQPRAFSRAAFADGCDVHSRRVRLFGGHAAAAHRRRSPGSDEDGHPGAGRLLGRE